VVLRGDHEHIQRRQCGQRNIEQEEVHPRQTLFRQTLGLAAGEADEDQAEIRQCEIEDVDRGRVTFSSFVGPVGEVARIGGGKG
jgi:hypothetical protein